MGAPNIAYTLHFYATSHRQDVRDKAQYAVSKGLPLFVTEWGTCEYDGNGRLDFEEVRRWLNFMDQNSIGDANWAVNDKAESCSALLPGATGGGGWNEEQLTES